MGVPAVVTHADQLLEAAQHLIDVETAQFEVDPSVVVSCKPNCNACCHHAVAVTAPEARAIASAVAALPASTVAQIMARADEITARVGAEGIGEDFQRRYYALEEPCPLLVEGQCAVRAVRPLVCREYLMSSSPQHCADPALEQVVRIRRRHHISANFASVSAQFGEPGVTFLPTALQQSPPPRGPSLQRSGPKLARLLRARRPTPDSSGAR